VNPAYAQAIERWHDFYLLAGGAAATLLGLLFIAVSLHIELFSGEKASRARGAAAQALTNFFTVLTIALIFLIPDQKPTNAVVTLLVFSILGFSRLIGSLITHHWLEGIGSFRVISQYILLPLAYNATMLYVAYLLVTENADGMGWLVWVIISILISATSTAWNMMVHLSRFDPAIGKP